MDTSRIRIRVRVRLGGSNGRVGDVLTTPPPTTPLSSLEKVEMKLIQKLRNTQQLQQQAFHELESALNGDV